ncbi:hypothetical protein [Corynebacterium deserti]|uniref:hypothetical protein n=1 Tax=Corynebacterium deserti TaxID=1408191 RepID=UPI0006AD52DA|nr:hypothetical protein [Corynebacterium deserti]
MSDGNNWNRDVFAFTIALQNVVWGIVQLIAGMLDDKFVIINANEPAPLIMDPTYFIERTDAARII